jgi:hypothetical protein
LNAIHYAGRRSQTPSNSTSSAICPVMISFPPSMPCNSFPSRSPFPLRCFFYLFLRGVSCVNKIIEIFAKALPRPLCCAVVSHPARHCPKNTTIYRPLPSQSKLLKRPSSTRSSESLSSNCRCTQAHIRLQVHEYVRERST